MDGWIAAVVVTAVVVALLTPPGRRFVVRHLTTRTCPMCFERFPRRRRSCPICRTRIDDFGGAPPPPNPLS